MFRKDKLFPGFAMLVVALLLLSGCSGAASPQAAAPAAAAATEEIPPVRTNTSVIAEGKVVPVQDAALSFSTAGVVEEVLVKEGDTVEADQPLIRLKGNEQMEAAVSGAELELLSANQAVDDLKRNADLARAGAQMELANANRELDKAQDRYDGKEYTRGDQESKDTARANLVLAQDAVDEAEKQYDRVDGRDEDDPVRAAAFSALAAARQKRDIAQANLNYVLERPNDLDVGEIDAQLAVAQAKVANAQSKLDLMKDGPDAELLALAEARVNNATVALDAARAQLDDLQLTAPFAGTVSAVNLNTGEAVSPAVVAVQLADFSTWQVETTDLTELNIERVKLGQPAMVRFDAIPDLDIIGRVTSIKPFGENRQGDVVYTVLLTLEVPDPRLRWNMTASVTFLEKDSAQ